MNKIGLTEPVAESVFVTDIGMKRKQNQDSGIARSDLNLFVVADGMGGHQGGEIASQLCVEKIVQHFEQFSHTLTPSSTLLDQGLRIANQSIFEFAQKEPHLNGMGTTVTMLHISNSLATILQVGDSRAYLWNEQGLWQLTRDHSLVQEKLRAGLITRSQVKKDEMKNVITRSVGYEPNVKGDLYQIPIQSGDGLLLCSDGLSGPVDDALMFEILEESTCSGLALKDLGQKLIAEANARGGDDNVSVVLVKIK